MLHLPKESSPLPLPLRRVMVKKHDVLTQCYLSYSPISSLGWKLAFTVTVLFHPGFQGGFN